MKKSAAVTYAVLLQRFLFCSNIWFDKGELQKIFQYSLYVGNLADFRSRSWQQKQRMEKERQEYLELNKEYLGENIIEIALKLSEILKDHPEKS